MNTNNAVVNIVPGLNVIYGEHHYIVQRVIDINKVQLINKISNESMVVAVNDISPITDFKRDISPDLNAIPDEEWRAATYRFDIIKPLLDSPKRTRNEVHSRAKECGVGLSTIYKWISAYDASGVITSLLPRERSDKGSQKLPADVETIIEETIESEYLASQKKTVQMVCDEVIRRCSKAGLYVPHRNTIRNRILSIPGEIAMSKRLGTKASAEHYRPLEGNFPGADWPLSVTQIDHTKLDIILVDDIDRRPVGRPWITINMDVFSRMVTGFYVSFDPPGALSTGLCLANSILPKDAWLAKHNIDAEWPCYGIPDKIHLDNAKEFRGRMLLRACKEWGINIEWRPAGNPHFGGNIERFVGTISKEIHGLPGTTFSNTVERKGYDSEGKAIFSLSEFETWLATYIVRVYHKKIHTSLGISPEEQYRKGILGDDTHPGTGLPKRVVDTERLRLDFMPFEERTVQTYGIVIDDIHYYHDVLRPWIDARDPKNQKLKRKLTFRRDPRDISSIWFYDPEVHYYFQIPFRDTSLPPISLWELREAKRRLEAEGQKNIDENAIFRAYDRMKEIEINAKTKTSAIRRARQRRPQRTSPTPIPVDGNGDGPNTSSIAIEPFEEMDDLHS
jgi:putative transposase